MRSKLTLIYCLSLVAFFAISFFVEQPEYDRADEISSRFEAIGTDVFDTESWKSTLSKITDYNSNVESDKGEQNKSTEKEPALSDAVLVGTVLATPSRAILIIGNEMETRAYNLGDGWLSPWVLHNIEADSVTWLNQQTNELKTQALFE